MKEEKFLKMKAGGKKKSYYVPSANKPFKDVSGKVSKEEIRASFEQAKINNENVSNIFLPKHGLVFKNGNY